ncbi:unnamed protein product [Porites evermanni]|uniref:Uncharacterized protein n=1 Tax=Porites evermanni TaxID=104178 RepID=A0ABN8LIH8_9CNID|nr:unnamed protein product [Porites evermanni]
MAAKQVQAYLERHHIGALFEDLMAKIIKDTPEEPVPFLIKVLKKMYAEGSSKGPGSSLPPSGSKAAFTRSMGLTGTSVGRHSFDEGRNALAKSWAGPDIHTEGSKYRPSSASKAGRDYPRPWLSGSSKPGKGGGAVDKDNMRPLRTVGNNERPPWNSKTAVPSHDFDEWFNMQHRPTRTADEGSLGYQGTSSWGQNGEMEMPAERTVIYNRQTTVTGPGSYADDDLDEELYVGRDDKIRDDRNTPSVISHESSRSRKQKARHAAEQHRRQLQALLQNKNPGRRDINGMNFDDLHDDGTELLENVDELEDEGVSSMSSTGTKLSKSVKQGMATSESIRVSICARCARIISGQPSDRKSEVGSVYSGSEVDENFDSVSQVGSTTGLRRPPVWPSGFDSESDSSPRKGQHMWQSASRSPAKGKHMFRGGSFTDDHPDSSRPQTASSSRSDLVYSGRQQKSWKFDGYSSDNDTEVNFDREETPKLGERRPWSRTPLESGSETDWEPRLGRRAPAGRGFARFNSGEDSDST